MKPPILMVALLAACAQRGVQPPRSATADSADQVLSGMATDITRNGLRVSAVQAESAWVYQNRQVSDLKRVTITFYNDTTGAVISVVTADRGTYNMRTQSLDARGHVVANSSEHRVLHTEHLVYDRAENRIMSDTAFTSTSPKGNAAGAAFEADPGFRNVTIDHPHGVRAKGKPFIIPGQGPVKP